MKNIFLCLFSILFTDLLPILDGRVTPIYIENRYTFTNFEWAKGRVYFRDGFDLPINGTAILDILDEPVDGNIVLRNSTLKMLNHLRLGRDVKITGSGFLNGKGNTLFIESLFAMGSNDRFIITSPMTFEGRNKTRFSPNDFIFTEGATEFTFKNIQLSSPRTGKFITAENRPNILRFEDAGIILATPSSSNYSFNCNIVQCIENLDIDGIAGGFVSINNLLDIRASSNVVINPQIALKVNRIEAHNNLSVLVLDAATLEYIFTETSSELFFKTGLVANSKANLIIKGKSKLKAPLGSEIIINKDTDVLIESGGRLEISPGIKLKIYS